MLLFEILIPIADNDGKVFDMNHHHKWDEEVKKISGGLSIIKPPILGKWISNSAEKEYIESIIRVRVACNQEQIEQIASLVHSHYHQQSVMYYQISNNVIIKHY